MTVELHAAYSWDCDECGTENFARAIQANLDEDVMRQAMDDGKLVDQHFETIAEPDAPGAEYIVTALAIAPQRVTCKQCGQTFETHLWSDEEEEES